MFKKTITIKIQEYENFTPYSKHINSVFQKNK
jgi:hypothetical protein